MKGTLSINMLAAKTPHVVSRDKVTRDGAISEINDLAACVQYCNPVKTVHYELDGCISFNITFRIGNVPNWKEGYYCLHGRFVPDPVIKCQPWTSLAFNKPNAWFNGHIDNARRIWLDEMSQYAIPGTMWRTDYASDPESEDFSKAMVIFKNHKSPNK